MKEGKIKAFLKKHWLGLVIGILIPQVTGAVSALIAGNIRETYQSLVQPPASPPGWIFPVAWVLLYTCMGIASYLVYISDAEKKEKIAALAVYAMQLLLNFSWSIVFFRAQAFAAGVIIILLLSFLVSVTMMLFYRIRKSAGYLLLPYLAWLLFASYLCIGVFVLN